MRRRILITPERHFVASAVALAALTVIACGTRGLVVLGILLPVVGQAILGGLTVERRERPVADRLTGYTSAIRPSATALAVGP